MASASSAAGTSTNDRPLFYCHKCRHQWRERENSDFVCPECNDGFIEEVAITIPTNPVAIERLQRERIAHSNRLDSFFARMLGQGEARSSDRSQTNRRRARSRSPRLRSFLPPPGLRLTNSRRRTPSPPIYRPQSSSSSSSSPPFYSNPPEDFGDIQISPPRPRHDFLEPPFDYNDIVGQFLSFSPQLPVNEERLDALPSVTITSEHDDTTCSICFDDFRLTDVSVRQLSCKHMFHELCIFPWLRINGTCPVCRAPLVDRPLSQVLSPRTMRQRNFADSLVRFMRLRNEQRHRTDNTAAAMDRREEQEEQIVSQVHVDGIDQEFLERRRRFRLASAALERARYSSAYRAVRAGVGRPVAGRIESVVNHIHDREFVAHELARLRGQPAVATIDLTEEAEENFAEPLSYEEAVSDVPPNRPVTVNDIRFAGIEPFTLGESSSSESSMSSSENDTSFDSEEELCVAPPLTPENPMNESSSSAATVDMNTSTSSSSSAANEE